MNAALNCTRNPYSCLQPKPQCMTAIADGRAARRNRRVTACMASGRLSFRRAWLFGGGASAVQDPGGGADAHVQGDAVAGMAGHPGHVGGLEAPADYAIPVSMFMNAASTGLGASSTEVPPKPIGQRVVPGGRALDHENYMTT